MRWLALFAVAACGGAPSAPVAPTADSADPAPTLVTDAVMDCTATTEDAKPGNYDRYAFESDDGRYGYKDGRGTVVIPPTLRHAYEFKIGGIAAAVDASSQFVFIDPSGKPLARAYAVDNGPDYFQEGFARIVDDNGKIGFISDHGIILIPPRFQTATSFCGGKTKVTENGTVLFVDRFGNPTPPPADPTAFD